MYGVARQGGAWYGLARLGMVWHGRPGGINGIPRGYDGRHSIDDETTEDIEAEDIAEPEDERMDWPRYAKWHLSRYPEDVEVVETITQFYRFELELHNEGSNRA